jgi:hypothetical protein
VVKVGYKCVKIIQTPYICTTVLIFGRRPRVCERAVAGEQFPPPQFVGVGPAEFVD